MTEFPPILTSNGQYRAAMKCLRLRWWMYEAPTGTAVRGWQRARLDLPLATGSACHAIVQELLQSAKAAEAFPVALDYASIIQAAREAYVREVREKGLELGLVLDGMVEEEKFLERTIEEQAALIEAFGWAFVRVRLPRLLEEYEVLSVEREEFTLLAGDVGLQSRCDAVLRRKVDGRVFVYNLKTSSRAHDRQWQEQWLVDQQLMTEILAVERRIGERVYGTIIDAFDKGSRVTCWWWTLKELREGFSKEPAEGPEKWQRQRSRLLYGYKCEEIPGKALYDFEGTTRKGWGMFAVWREEFAGYETFPGGVSGMSPVEYWINWLPEEQVASQFATLPPIMRLDEQVEAKVRQIVAGERRIRRDREAVELNGGGGELLDRYFPQNDGWGCHRCSAWRLCWDGGADDPAANGFEPREPNHPESVEE